VKKKASLLLRAGLSVVLLAWLLSRTDLTGIAGSFRTVRWGWFAAGALLHVSGVLLTAWRWGILLRAQAAPVPTLYLARSFLISSFFNYFLPTSVGGDVYRAYDTGRYTREPEKALGILLVERISGLFALLLLAVAATPWAVQVFGSPALAVAPLVLAGIFILAAVLLFWERFVHRAGRLFDLPVLARVKERVRRVHEAIVAYRYRRGAFAAAFGVGLLLQLNFVVHHYCLSESLSLGVPLGTFLFLVPLVSVLLLIPASINGIGVRENAFVVLLGQVGVAREGSVAFCALLFAAMLLFGVAGGITYAAAGRKEAATRHGG